MHHSSTHSTRRPLRTATFVLIGAALFGGNAYAQQGNADDLMGFHVGVFGGYANGSYESAATAEIDHDPSGSLYGLQMGWTQPAGDYVFGIVGDIAGTSIDGEDTITVQGFRSDSSHEVNYLGTVRARFGVMAGSALFYGTAGLAVGDLENRMVVTSGGQPVGSDSEDTWHTGWAAGFGVEYAVSDAMSINAEYLRMDLGEDDVALDIGGFPFEDKGDMALNTLRVGVNFRF